MQWGFIIFAEIYAKENLDSEKAVRGNSSLYFSKIFERYFVIVTLSLSIYSFALLTQLLD